MAARTRYEEIYSRTKLASGLVLFTFLATHLINHTLGIVSLQAMDAGSGLFKFVWRSWPGTLLLYAAAITHPLLALFNWLRRGHYRGIPWQGWAQLALGLCVPPLVVDHVIGTRGLHEAMGVNDSYAYVLIVQFVQEPLIGLRQNILILIAWGHGCIGIYYWLRLKNLSERIWPFLFGLAFAWGATGTTNIAAVGDALGTLVSGGAVSAALILGLGFLTTGVAFKIAAVPFHYWTPDAYQGSPTPVTGYLSVGPKIGAFALILRLFVEALGPLKTDWLQVIVILAILTMTLGNLVALTQTNVKRMLAYSSIENTRCADSGST